MINTKMALLADKFKKHDKDSGSVEVQIVRLTGEIGELQGHCQQNPKDFSSQRGLLKKVNAHKRFLTYVKRTAEGTYKDLVKELGLRK
jgi:small subunit ribosomal protein S15